MNNHLIYVACKTNDYYRFIYKLQYLNLKIYDVKYQNNQIFLKINKSDYAKLKKYLISYKFRIVDDVGIYKIINKMKKNHLFIFLFICGLSIYFLLTNIIVEVNVIHENKEIRDLITEELKERGIKVLSFKKSYKTLDKIKQELLDKYPDRLDWLEIEEHGMAYDIKIEERIITDTSIDNHTCDIVAKKSGIISNILLNAGEVVVDLNDYVKEGDTLISGKIMYNEEEKRSICAKGEVYAQVWYTVDVSIPFKYYEYIKTGKRKFNFIWEKDGNKKTILKERFASFASVTKTIFKAFDFRLYLESEYETIKKEQKYTEKEALDEALNKARENITKKLGAKDKIIDQKVLKKSINDSTMDVEVFVIVEELISMEKETVPEIIEN